MTEDATPVDEKPGETPPEEVKDAAESPDKEKTLLDKAREAAAEVAHQIVDPLKELIGSSPSGDPEEGSESPRSDPSSPRSMEQAAEDAVRSALEKIGLEGKTVNVDKIEVTTPDAKEPEKSPIKMGRVSQFLWGDRE